MINNENVPLNTANSVNLPQATYSVFLGDKSTIPPLARFIIDEFFVFNSKLSNEG